MLRPTRLHCGTNSGRARAVRLPAMMLESSDEMRSVFTSASYTVGGPVDPIVNVTMSIAGSISGSVTERNVPSRLAPSVRAAAFTLAGLFQALVPQELIVRWMGQGSGWRGLLIGMSLGGVTPANPIDSAVRAAIEGVAGPEADIGLRRDAAGLKKPPQPTYSNR